MGAAADLSICKGLQRLREFIQLEIRLAQPQVRLAHLPQPCCSSAQAIVPSVGEALNVRFGRGKGELSAAADGRQQKGL